MFTKNRRKNPSDNIKMNTGGERDVEEEDKEEEEQDQRKHQSIFNVSAPIENDKSNGYISHLLHQADLSSLIPLDPINRLKYFLDERSHMSNQMDLIRSQYEKQYSIVKRRLEETENENERLTNQYRSSSKELLLYKTLVDAPNNPNSPSKSKDYQQLKQTIDKILEENQQLYAELNRFKTTDPVYEQVQLLETTNQHLKQELIQLINENNHLKQMIHIDENNNLKLHLTKTLEECEQLKLINKKLVQQQSSKQISVLSVESIHHESFPTEVRELREHIQRLEQILHQRDFELQKLQNEIEKGTSSIMSSIEDLYIVSSNVSSNINTIKTQPNIDDLQNELDQLHDKLDELTRENQLLKTRTQEFDTIYEENEYLYAEKSQWNEEIERLKLRQLLLEQELHTLKEREKDYLLANDSTTNENFSQFQLKIDWFKQTNHQLELEILHLNEQNNFILKNYEQSKQDFENKIQYYKQILDLAKNEQNFPQELFKLEKYTSELEQQFENERQEYEKTILALEEQSEQREQKYSAIYDTIVKLQNEYRQKELEFAHQMDEITKQRDRFQHAYEQIQQENNSLKDEISSKNEINRDLKLALTSSNNDTQNLQIEQLRDQNKQIITNYDAEILKLHQTIIQLQHDNKQYASQIERYQLNIDKLQNEINEKQTFIQQIQNDLAERSALHVSINNQLTQENNVKAMKLIEFEQTLAQEQQYKVELERQIQDLQTELHKSRTIAKESLEKSDEYERRFHETDKHFLHLNETTEPTRRELNTLRIDLIAKIDQNTTLQHQIEDEKLRRQRLEMKLKRLKEEYLLVRKELYNRLEENQKYQHDIIEYRFKADYYSELYNQTFQSNENQQSSTAVQLYLKEKAENQHCQIKYGNLQQKFEQLQKNYDSIKEKYKQRLHEERELFERTKCKYLEHIKNVQNDLNETRKLLEKDAEMKINQELAYQQLIDERRQLLTSMIDKDAKVREMRRENLLLTSKIQLLENQMENLNDRIDRTLRERNLIRRDLNAVRLDSNLSIGAHSRSSSVSPMTKTITTYIESTGWNQPVYYKESIPFNTTHQYEISTIS